MPFEGGTNRQLRPVVFMYKGLVSSESNVYHVRSKGNFVLNNLIPSSTNKGGIKISGRNQPLNVDRENDNYTIALKDTSDVETTKFHFLKNDSTAYYGEYLWNVFSRANVITEASDTVQWLSADIVKVDESSYGYLYIINEGASNSLRFQRINVALDTTTNFFVERGVNNLVNKARVTRRDGKLICGYYDTTNSITFRTSADNGESWLKSGNISNPNIDNNRVFGLAASKNNIYALVPRNDDLYLYLSSNDSTNFVESGPISQTMPADDYSSVDLLYSSIGEMLFASTLTDSTGLGVWESVKGVTWDLMFTQADGERTTVLCEHENGDIQVIYKTDATTGYYSFLKDWSRSAGYSLWNSSPQRVIQIEDDGDYYFDNLSLLNHQGILRFLGNAFDATDLKRDFIELQFKNRSQLTLDREFSNSYFPSFGVPDTVGDGWEKSGAGSATIVASNLHLDATSDGVSWTHEVPYLAGGGHGHWVGSKIYFRAKIPHYDTVADAGKFFVDLNWNAGNDFTFFQRFTLDSTQAVFKPAVLGGATFEDATSFGHDFTHEHDFCLVNTDIVVKGGVTNNVWDVYMSEVNTFPQEWSKIMAMAFDATSGQTSGPGYVEMGVLGGNIQGDIAVFNEDARTQRANTVTAPYEPLDLVGIDTSFYQTTIDRGIQAQFGGSGGVLNDSWAADVTTTYLPENIFDKQSDAMYISFQDSTAHLMVFDLDPDSTAFMEEGNDTTSSIFSDGGGFDYYFAQEFTPDSYLEDKFKISVFVSKTGSPPGDLRMRIFEKNFNDVDDFWYESVNKVQDAAIDATFRQLDFIFVNDLPDTTTYVFALYPDEAGDGSNYYEIYRDEISYSVQTIDPCDTTTGWIPILAIYPQPDATIFKEGVASLKLGKDQTATNIAWYRKTLSPELDLTDMSCGIWFFVNNKLELDATPALRFEFGQGTGNHYYKQVAQSELVDIVNDGEDGWNLLGFDAPLQDWDQQGSPDTTGIDFVRLKLFTPSAEEVITSGDIKMDDWKGLLPNSNAAPFHNWYTLSVDGTQTLPANQAAHFKIVLDTVGDYRVDSLFLQGSNFEQCNVYAQTDNPDDWNTPQLSMGWNFVERTGIIRNAGALGFFDSNGVAENFYEHNDKYVLIDTTTVTFMNSFLSENGDDDLAHDATSPGLLIGDGKFGSGMEFSNANTNDGPLTFSNSNIVAPVGSFAMWVKLKDTFFAQDSTRGYMFFVCNDDVGNSANTFAFGKIRDSALLSGSNGALGVVYVNGIGATKIVGRLITTGAPELPLNEWIHFAVTWDDDSPTPNIVMYQNGVAYPTALSGGSLVAFTPQTKFWIGGTGTWDANAVTFVGQSDTPAECVIDDVRIDDYEWTSTYINEVYAKTTKHEINVERQFVGKIEYNTTTTVKTVEDNLVAYGIGDGQHYSIYDTKAFKLLDDVAFRYWALEIPAQKTRRDEGYYAIKDFDLGFITELGDESDFLSPIKDKRDIKSVREEFRYDNGQTDSVSLGEDIRMWDLDIDLLNQDTENVLKQMFEELEGGRTGFWVVFYYDETDKDFFMVRMTNEYGFRTEFHDRGSLSMALEEIKY